MAAAWPYPSGRSDKYAKGVVGIDRGPTYPGAGIMSTFGAVHGGAGMVRFLGPESARPAITSDLPNVVFAPGRVQAHLLGSGWSEKSDGRASVAEAVDSGLPGVIDADGLGYRPDVLPERCLLTPHAGELAALLGCRAGRGGGRPAGRGPGWRATDRGHRAAQGRHPARRPAGGRTVEVAVPGPAWTGQAGSGDTLGGLCAAVLAAGVPAHTAAVLAASLQAVTAATHPGPLPPHVLAQRCADQSSAPGLWSGRGDRPRARPGDGQRGHRPRRLPRQRGGAATPTSARPR